jgi:dipeptidyl aminopeptidase/acylaminoacyl peptidase
MAFTIGYFASFGFKGNQSLAESQFRKFRVDTIVADADIRNSAISPNGKYLALVQVKNGVQSLYLRQIENGNTVEIVPRINGKFIGADFSPGGEQIYYSVNETLEPSKPAVSTLYKVSVFGGASQQILHDIDSPVAISPDESRLAFIRRNPESKETALILRDIEGKNERSLTVRQLESGFTNGGVAWSPDGKSLSATVFQRENQSDIGSGGGRQCRIRRTKNDFTRKLDFGGSDCLAQRRQRNFHGRLWREIAELKRRALDCFIPGRKIPIHNGRHQRQLRNRFESRDKFDCRRRIE